MGWLMAAELRAHGVDLSFAPCVDLDYGVSEVIGDRAFHSKPEVVAQLALAYMSGMKDAGMAATAKHFPGHGAVVADSHKALPVDRRAWNELGDDLLPYRRLIANGIPGVMVAHIQFPAVDPAPASLSRRWIQNALREELRFEGAVFTDDLIHGWRRRIRRHRGARQGRARRRLRRAAGVQRPRQRRQAARRARNRGRTRAHICGWCACADVPRPSATRCTRAMPGAPARICWRARKRTQAQAHRGQRMNGFQGDFLRGALDVSPEGVVICEATGDRVVVYVNPAFCRLTGYEPSDLLGKNLRMLQGEDRDQQELDSLREALRHNEPVRVLVRNLRKDGTVFVNDMQIYPLRNGEGKATHLIGYHREGGTRVRTGDTGIRGLPNWVREDRLTGLASRYYFEDVLKRDFALAQRDKTDIALLLFDIDQLGPYNEVFERAGGDAVVKRVARAIAGSFRRGTDIVGRWEGASVIVLMHGTHS